MPEQDAVVVITSGVRSMQDVMNHVWDKILPALQPQPLAADATAHQRLVRRLQSLTVHPPSGQATSPLAATIAGRRYVFPANEQHLESVTLAPDDPSGATTVVIRADGAEHRVACGASGAWVKGRTTFLNGISRRTLEPGEYECAATGAWAASDTYVIKNCLYETPVYLKFTLQFAGDTLTLDSGFSVAFGDTDQPQLVGHADAAPSAN